MSIRQLLLTSLVSVTTLAGTARAAEICGNGLDDDADGVADEGCYPTLTTGQCESPLSCEDTGQVSPSSGSLRYSLPPDVSPSVPYGPGIGLRRFFLSLSQPTGGAPAYRTAFGPRWGHTYATWIDDVSAGGPTKIILHTTRGQDVLLNKTSSDATWDYFTPTPGHHYKSFKRRLVSPFDYEITLLTGDSFTYNGSGRLTGIRDTLLNTVALAYAGDGQLQSVTDASGKRRLLFTVTGGVITAVEFQINTGAWTTYHTTTYGYTSGNLTAVTVGGQLAHTNLYTANYLTSIQDGGGNTLVSFAYDSATPGKVVRVDTPRGVVGYEFASSRANCSGKTVVFFHKQNATSCNVDGDCGTGYLCGGKTGTGSTGQCFRGARCLTVASPSEDVVTTVSAVAGGTETCDGACLDALEYIWNTAGGALDNTAIKSPDPSVSYTVKAYNANGLPTQIMYGSSDTVGTGKLREEFLAYDATYPGRITHRSHASDLATYASPALTCASAVDGGCTIDIYQWNANGTLASSQRYGYSLTTSDARTTIGATTYFTYDPQGRVTQVQVGANPTVNRVVYEYWASTNPPLFAGFLQNVKRYTTATLFLTQSSQDFDFWGNATRVVDSDGTVSCQTFDPARGYLTQRREQMAAQTDCTANGADLVTSYARDSALRLTQLTRPDNSCMIYEYDTRGRLSKTKRRDDCNALSGGDREEYTYSAEGLMTKVETFNDASIVTKRQELTYFDSRRIEKLINPVNTAKWTGFAYEDRGLVASVTAVDGANNLSKTDWSYNKDARVTSEKRYTVGTSFDTWNLLFSWINDQKQVTDGDGKITTSTRDDHGNVVKLSSPDLGGFPTLRTVDNFNRLTTIKESFGSGGVKTHTFTYDAASRPLNSDYSSTCQTFNIPDIVRVYDCVGTSGGCTSGAPACPAGTSCTNLSGRVAYVKVKLMCTTVPGPVDGDYTLEQETWYGYDAAGRLTHEYIKDDSSATDPRIAAHVYAWTKNGALQQVTLPSTAAIGWTYGSAASNSDTDRIAEMWRGTIATPVASSITWEPYGPLYRYNHQSVCGAGPALRTTITHNLAYRVTQTKVNRQDDTTTFHQVSLAEDAKGRITKRDYYPSNPQIAGLFDSWFKYDLQDRVLCETTGSVASCPTSGSNIKNSHTQSPPFMAAGDWKQLKRPIPGSTGLNHDFTLFGGTHQISTVTQNDGSPALGETAVRYDSRGNRNLDDNQAASPLTNDERTYIYDDRRNLVNVRGQYKTGGVWHYYNVASSFDAKNRRVFKSFFDETTLKTATWFFYYDPLDRLSEVRYTPDTAVSTTYQVFQLFWIGNRLVAYWQTDYPAVTTTKRYVGTDETGRPIDMINWPASGNCTRVWSVNPDAWGNDTVLIGPTLFQPILFAGQYRDDETVAWQNDGVTRHRPGVVLNGYRTYDPWTGSYLQVDPMVSSSWSSYVYVDSDPVGKKDPKGLWFVLDEFGNTQFCRDTHTAVEIGGIIFLEGGGCTVISRNGDGFWNPDPSEDDPPIGDGPHGGGSNGGPYNLTWEVDPQRRNCQEELDYTACAECCYWNWDNVDYPNCTKKRSRTARVLCYETVAAVMGACIAACVPKRGGPLGTWTAISTGVR